jgi:Zn-dependent peptidase ImmA (M78 family)
MNKETQAILHATMAAARLHKRLEKEESLFDNGRVNIFEAVFHLGVPLLFRPLDQLLGAFLNDPAPGVLVTTRRPLSVQRFTVAHELGHQQLGHTASLDQEGILARSPYWGSKQDLQELEANAFAAAFLMPRSLMAQQCKRHGWTGPQLQAPIPVYQLSLRLGASYEATCWALHRYDFLTLSQAKNLAAISPKEIKSGLLGGYRPETFWGDVWLLDEHDRETRVSGSRSDLFIFHLPEHSGGGYLWNFDELAKTEFRVVRDERESVSDGIGSNSVRRVTAESEDRQVGMLHLREARPWQPAEALHEFVLEYDLTGPEQSGASIYERRQLLEVGA